MAERVEWFDVLVPAGTLKTAPVETVLRFNQGDIERLDLTIPDGHAGLTGIRFNSAHQQIIPFTPGSYIIGNGRQASWDLHGFPNNGNWSVTCYNTDVYDHTFHIEYLVNEIGGAGLAPVALQGPIALGAAVTAPAAAGPIPPPAPTPPPGV